MNRPLNIEDFAFAKAKIFSGTAKHLDVRLIFYHNDERYISKAERLTEYSCYKLGIVYMPEDFDKEFTKGEEVKIALVGMELI